MGDEKQVTWQVQLAKLLTSEDHLQTSRGAQIMIPSTVKDVSIKVVHIPAELDFDNKVWRDVQGNIVARVDSEDPYGSYVPAQEVDYEVPVVETLADVTDNDTYRLSSFVKNPYGSLSEVKDSVATYGVDPSTFENQPDWDFYQVGLNAPGVFTFEVTGTVESVGEDTYVPIRAENMLWRCSGEGGGPGSAEEGCKSLKEYPWARSGELPPVTTAEQSEDTRNKIIDLYKKQGTSDGLTGVGTCAVTQNTGRVDTIGADIEPAVDGKYGAYAQTFNLHLTAIGHYYGSLKGAEDNCDQGFQHITLCPDEESEVPPSKEPVESEEPTPSEEEEVEPAKPSKETEEPTSSEEPQESEEPTPSEEPQEPEQEKPVKPGERPEKREEPKIPVVPPTVPDTDTEQGEVVTTVVEPEQDKPADSKPESKPAPKTVISESVKDNVAKQAKSTAKKDRPKVTTGGHLRAA
ncbi:hypothetical protein EML15_09185 [Corynebacterium sp. sy017]|uniref:hypothetical protein n=1 Tax=unclassified Corynebacterium TaxID=2624378 RepID=UPI0011853280|nr:MULTISPECIES: hypothetical protein [unclassified Corynebacterium]MBP3089312.1 hypothetical protein [Corynebacterium sp. sy017]TSD90988.1 hypothetical protein ELY17_09415 [Corynebacterium sp. SY003]